MKKTQMRTQQKYVDPAHCTLSQNEIALDKKKKFQMY